MGELILHIGTTKTGTSSLQRFFFDNRQELLAHGVRYPIFTDQPRRSSVVNANFINTYCLALAKGRNPRGLVNDIEANLELLTKSLSGHERVLLSDENISLDPAWISKGKSWAEPYWRTLAATLSEAGARNVTIVVYLRRQDDWVASRWRYATHRGFAYGASLKDYCANPSIRCAMNYERVLNVAEEAFDHTARIVVRRYDRSSFVDGDIVRDFCTTCDIPWNGHYKPLEREINPSITFDVAEALRPFAELAPNASKARMEALLPLAKKLSHLHPDAPRTTPFGEDAARALMKPYLEGNARISEKYLGGEPLFSDDYCGRPVWVPDEARIAEHRATFEEALRRYEAPSDIAASAYALLRRLPEGIKRPLRNVRKRLPHP